MSGLLLAALLGRTAALGQDPWSHVPSEAVAAMVVQRPDQLAALLLELVDELETPEQIALVTGEPHPLATPEQMDCVLREIRRTLELVDKSTELTVFIVGPGPDWRYCAILGLPDGEDPGEVAHGMEDLASRIAASESGMNDADQPSVPEERDEAPGLPVEGARPDMFFQISLEVMKQFRPTIVTSRENALILSNSAELADWVGGSFGEAGDSAHAPRPITKDRRFLRARGCASGGGNPVVSAYFLPTTVLPWLDAEKYTTEHLALMGYGELVGAWCEARIESSGDPGLGPRLQVSMSVPHTEPPLGITEYWKCTSPVKTVPDIRSWFDKHGAIPEVLRITSGHRREMLEALEQAYAARGKLDEFAAKMEAAAAEQWAPGVESWRSFFDGYLFELSFSLPVDSGGDFFAAFLRHDDLDKALEFVRQSAKNENRVLSIPLEAVRFGEYEGWFRSRESALRQAIMDGEEETVVRRRDFIPNQGSVALPRWIMYCDRHLAELMEDQPIGETGAGSLLEELLPGLDEMVDEVEPWWLEVKWPGISLDLALVDLRFAYFSIGSDRSTAHRKLIKHPISTEFPIESKSDRLYLVMERLVRWTVRRKGAEFRAFSSREGHFLWSWRNIPFSEE